MKILIIEDEKDLSESINAYLNREGYLCEKALDFDQASEKIQLYQYDCIIVDIMLPDGSGLEIVQELKKNHIPSGVIIVSAKNALDDKIRGLNIGADDYLTKPFHLSELSARIKSIIRRKNFLNDSVKKFRRFERQQQAGIIIPPLNQESTGLAGSESQLS